MRIKNILYFGLGTAIILLIPLVAMQFTTEVNWTLSDFIFMGTLLFGSGLAYEFVTAQAKSNAYRYAAAIGIFTALLLVWINGAVGIIGNENNPANLLYAGVLLIGFVGAIAARFKPRGMSLTLFAAAIGQALVPVIAFIAFRPPVDSPEAVMGLLGVCILSWFFSALFLWSGLLFKEANEQAESPKLV